MKLYGDLISPFVRMSMVTAYEAGIGSHVQLMPTVVKPQEVNVALAKLSPIGKIPILETDHGHPIYDSRVIMEYLVHHSGKLDLLPHEGAKRFRILTMLALSQGMADAAVALRYESFARPEALRWAELAERGKARVEACMDELDKNWLSDLGDVTLGAIATVVALGYIDFRNIIPDWRKGRGNLSHFFDQFGKRDSMVFTALKA